ncbi:302_t:CDS:2 [Racocetra fulgida]|uniref:302_t:CDS:1 n=1 Tax=Racocetra fulgida TaxID=60492 RepID=A0A9N9AF75_9GLOM|nr:302_t:CDS:2 [Racocetra fulgida]
MVADNFLPSYLRDSPLYKNNKRLYSRVPLPTHWNPADSSSYVAIVDDKNLTVKYDANPSDHEIITHNTNPDVAPDPETTPVIRAIAETQMNANDTNIINTMTSTPSDLENVVSSNVPVDSTYSTTTL